MKIITWKKHFHLVIYVNVPLDSIILGIRCELTPLLRAGVEVCVDVVGMVWFFCLTDLPVIPTVRSGIGESYCNPGVGFGVFTVVGVKPKARGEKAFDAGET